MKTLEFGFARVLIVIHRNTRAKFPKQYRFIPRRNADNIHFYFLNIEIQIWT